MKDIYWIANTREVMSNFPEAVRNEMGFALYCEQIKIPHPNIKPLKGFKQAVREIKTSYRGNAYRAVYVVNLGGSLYVLNVFQKKSKSGIGIPKPDMDIIKRRLKLAEDRSKETGK